MSGGLSRFLLAPSCCRKAGQVERIGGNTVRGNGRPGRAEARRHTTTWIPQSRSIGLLLPVRRGQYASNQPLSRNPIHRLESEARYCVGDVAPSRQLTTGEAREESRSSRIVTSASA